MATTITPYQRAMGAIGKGSPECGCIIHRSIPQPAASVGARKITRVRLKMVNVSAMRAAVPIGVRSRASQRGQARHNLRNSRCPASNKP